MTTYATARAPAPTPLRRRLRRLSRLPGATELAVELAAIAEEIGDADPMWRDALLLVATLLED